MWQDAIVIYEIMRAIWQITQCEVLNILKWLIGYVGVVFKGGIKKARPQELRGALI